MKKKYKMLFEVVAKKETENGAVGLQEHGKLLQGISKITEKAGFDCYIKGYPKDKLNYKPTNKKIIIKTVEDIAKLSEQQFEFFIDDLREWSNLTRQAQDLKDLGLKVGTSEGMIWLDTGLNESKVNIEIVGTNKI